MKIFNLSEIQSFPPYYKNLFNSKRWLSVISKTYKIDFKCVINSNHQFMLPFCLLEDKFFPTVKSIPFGDYTLINYPEPELSETLQFLRETYPERYVETTVVSKKIPVINKFTSINTGSLIQINIAKWKESRDWKEAYERNIRNALNYGLAVKISSSLESLNRFYILHEQLRINKFNKLPQPFRFFTNIYNEFVAQKKGFLLEVWNKDILIASWLILKHRDILYYKMGASIPEYLKLRPNDLLFRSLMQYGSDQGFKIIDLGYSGATKSYEGLIRFKKKEGGEMIPIFHLEYFPENFKKTYLQKKTNYLTSITKKAIDTNNIEIIRKTSNNNYHKFA